MTAGPREGADPARGTGRRATAEELLRLLDGKYRVQVASTLAALGVADLLARAPLGGAEAAAALGCDAANLERLLRAAHGLGFLERPEPDVYALTPLGRELCSEALGPLAAFVGSPEQWDPWARLRRTMRAAGGETPFEETFGVGLYEFLERSPEAAARYDRAIHAFTRHEADELRRVFDFGRGKTLVDVGGGQGALLYELLPRWPELRGVLFDRPRVVERAREHLPRELEGRVSFQQGDFFGALPQGHEYYCLKHVLHNWDDERATALLAACARAMGPDGRTLVIEAVLMPDSRLDLARILDLEMGVLTGGKVRRKPELRSLFRAAGLTLESVRPVGESWLLVGARRAGA